MCGRFLNTHPSREIARAFRAMMDQLAFDSFARSNITPSQPIRVVREASSGHELASVRWGFVPRWAQAIVPAYEKAMFALTMGA